MEGQGRGIARKAPELVGTWSIIEGYGSGTEMRSIRQTSMVRLMQLAS